MAGSFGDWLELQVLNWLHGTAMPAVPTTLYASLLTALPGDEGTGAAPQNGTEATGTAGTSRTSLGSPATATSAVAQPGTQTPSQFTFPHAGPVTFTNSSGSSWSIVAIAVWDGNAGTSADHLLFYVPVTATVANGQGLQFLADSCSLTLD